MYTYQDEELGLNEANIAHADLQDPFGIRFWPDFKGRDGCRTPMPWTADAPHAGFSDAVPWLPVPTDHLAISVEAQERDLNSVLNAFKNFLSWRKSHPALLHGDIKFLDSPDGTLAFVRTYKRESMLAVFNLTNRSIMIPRPESTKITNLQDRPSPAPPPLEMKLLL
nr:hypothetical protein [Paremcibacter congregatus]